MKKERLNVNVARAITDFEQVMKEFQLKEKVWRIIYRGKGLEFDGYREYMQDDDAVNIDWKASQRANQLLVKRYKEERDLEIVFLVDVSENMLFGSVEKLKCENVAEMLAALSHLIISSNDKIGFVFFSDKIKEYVPPKGGINQLYFFIDKLSDPDSYNGGSNPRVAFDFALRYLPKSIHAVFFVSDFIRMKKDALKNLYLLSHKFETTAFMVKDPLDVTLPDIDKEIVIEDPVSGQQLLVNPKMARRLYEKHALAQEKESREIFLRANVDFFKFVTDKYFVYPLAEFLKGRLAKRG